MDNQKEKRSLSDIANEIRILLINTAKKDHFRSEIKVFYEEYKAWEKEEEEYSQVLQVRNGEDEKACEKRIKKLKEPRPCPLDFLDLSDTYKERHLLDITNLVCLEGPELSAKESKMLEACYVLLAIFHDNFFEHNRRNIPISDGIWPQDEMWVETKWNEIKDNAYQPALQDEMNYIFELVEADLAKLSETGQDIAPTKDKKKKAKIACLFKKIIGRIFKKTSRVIGAVIIAIIVVILVDIFADFGWIERIKAVIYKILQLN